MKIRVLSATDVRAALPMPRAIEAMRLAFGQFSAGEAVVPLRGRLNSDKGVTLLMPAFLKRSRHLAVKVVSVFGDNPSLGLPTIAGLVLVMDAETGIPQAVMEGDSLTALRTGAAGGLAADLLARPDAATAALHAGTEQGRRAGPLPVGGRLCRAVPATRDDIRSNTASCIRIGQRGGLLA